MSSLFKMRRNLQKKLQNTEVEEVQSTLQFSTSVELRPGNVTLLVSQSAPDLDNRSKDFANFWSEVRYRYSKKTDESFFRKKIWNAYKKIDLCFFQHLEFFLVNFLTPDFFKTLRNGR